MLKRQAYKGIVEQQNSSGLSAMFLLALLLVQVLAKNPDWSNNRLLWWGSVAFLVFVFLVEYRGVLTIEYNYTLWLLSFLGICVLSFLWATKGALVFSAIKSVVVHAVILLIFCSTIKSPKAVEQILKIIVISVVINVIWLLYNSADIYSGVTGSSEHLDRLGNENAWNANDVGMMSATAMLIALYFYKKEKRIMLRVLYVGVVLLMALAALLSGSRKALVMLLLSIGGFAFLTSKGKRLRAIVVVGCAVVGLWYIVMEVPLFYSVIGYRMEGLWAQITGEGTADNSAQVRDLFVTDAIRAWRERPILGWGLDCYREVNRIEKGMYAHNNYVELLADLGIVGTAIYYSAYVYCFTKLIKIKPKDNLTWTFIVMLLVMVVTDYGCVSYNSFLTKNLVLLMFIWISINRQQGAVKG